jgi:hypothetical protein
MFLYDSPYLESSWRHEADERELAELDADRRDMQEVLILDEPARIESAESLRYLAWGPDFADDAGPIGMHESKIEQAIRHKLQRVA